MEDYTDLTKQIEGNSLALNAVAEILSKMDAKLSRDEEVAIAKEEAAEKATERESLVADITKSVLESIKAEISKADEEDDDADKGEEIANPEPGMEAVQEPVLAKEHTDEHMEEEEEEEDEDMEKGKKYSMKSEDADGEDIEKSLREKIAELEKALEDTDGRIEKAVKAESEARLRRMGFKEENGLKAPVSRSLTPAGTQVSLGAEEAPYISKGAEATNPEDVIDQLSQLSFKQLRDMQEQLESGNTDGIPQELLNN